MLPKADLDLLGSTSHPASASQVLELQAQALTPTLES